MGGPPAVGAEQAGARRAEAVVSFFRDDPARTLEVASGLRGQGLVIESTIRGGSMGAALPDGCRVRIELAQRDRYEVGEVVGVVTGPVPVVHRVVATGRTRRSRGWLVTRGDARILPDPPARVTSVLGPVATWSHRSEGPWRAVAARAPLPAGRRAARSLLLAGVTVGLDLAPRPTLAALAAIYRTGSLLAGGRLRLGALVSAHRA